MHIRVLQLGKGIIFVFLIWYPLTLWSQVPEMIENENSTDAVMRYLVLSGAFEKAFELAGKGLNNTLTDEQGHVEWLLRTSELHFRYGNLTAGKAMLDAANNRLTRIKSPGHRLLFYHTLQQGRYCLLTGDYAQSMNWLVQAEHHLNALPQKHPIKKVNLWNEFGMLHQCIRDYPTAIRYFQSAISSIQDHSVADRHEVILLKARMADACRLNLQKKKTDQLVHDCVAYLDTLKNPLHPALLETYLILDHYRYSFFGNDGITSNYLHHASAILTTYYPHNHYYTGILYARKAEQEFFKSNFENALQYSNHALTILSRYRFLDRYRQQHYHTLAQGYYWLEQDYEKTIAFCREAIHQLQATESSPAYLHYLTGLSYFHLRDPASALKNLHEVIALANENGLYPDHYDCAVAYQELGNYFLRSKEAAKGQRFLFKAAGHAGKYQQQGYLLSGIYKDIGNSFAWTHDYRQALAYYQRSLVAGSVHFSDTSVHANPSPDNVFMIHTVVRCLTDKAYTLYLLYEAENEPLPLLNSALTCQEVAVKLIEKRIIDINEEKSGLVIGDLLKRALNNAVSYAVLLYQKTGERQYANKAWEYAEKSKMQVLSIHTMKKNNLQLAGLPDSLILENEKLRQEIVTIENQLALETRLAESDPSRHEILARLAGLYDRRDVLITYLEEKYPAYKLQKYKYAVAGIEEIQQHLEEDQVIIEYQLLRTELITFFISKSDFNIYFRLIDNALPATIEKLRNMVATDPLLADPVLGHASFVETSYCLFTWLIEPVYEKLRQKRLIVIPHGKLTEIPFEVLIRKKPEHSASHDYRSLAYLIREFPITYAYNANLLIQENSGKFGCGTGIFQPDYRSYRDEKSQINLLPLAGAANESRQIKKITRGKLFQNHKADESTFKARAPRFRILHIASHAMVNEKNPDLSCLVMTAPVDSGSDGFLYSYEIAQMDLQAQFVVLSGCNTGFGLLRRNEGLISIARSFFYAGIRTVMYTLWPITDQAGSELTGSFYLGLRHRQTPDKALRMAKLDFLGRADPVKTHPFYWAGYVMVGKTDRLPLSRPIVWLIIPVVTAIVLIMLIRFRKFNN